MPEERNECSVLVVDDDQFVCASMIAYLNKQGMAASCAANGKEALDLFYHTKPDVIVADLRMPVMDGLQLLEQVHANGSEVPVIIATGNPDMESAIKALQQGAFDYVLKPVNLVMLLEKIRRAAEKRRLNAENRVLSEQVSFYAMTGKLAATHHTDALLDIIFRYGLEMTGSQKGMILLGEGREDELVYARQKGSSAANGADPDAETVRCLIATWCFTQRRTLCIDHGMLCPEVSIHEGCKKIHALIAVPLVIQNRAIGAFIVERDVSKPSYSSLDTNRMEILSSQAGIALNNAHLYSSLNQKVEELKLVSTFSEQLMGRIDRTDLIKSLFEKIREQCSPDVIAFLHSQHRKSDYFYWSRGSIDEVDLWQLFRIAADSCRAEGTNGIDERKVSVHQLLQGQRANYVVRLPLEFYRSFPVVWEDAVIGVFFVGSVMQRPELQESEALISGLVNQARISLVNAKLYNDMRVNYMRTIKALAIAVDAKDKYTLGHSEKVMLLAEELAREIKDFDARKVTTIRDAALLHDIGKIGIPGTILNKPGPLSYDEFNGVMKSHSTLGANIVRDVPFLNNLYKLILHHHEHYDGSGYPAGLKGEDIPLGARILHLADAFDAMTSDRPYRSSLGCKEAIQRIVADSGKHFDPVLVGVFLRVARRKGIID
ncbi:MAG: response regulator [Chitinispirillaceae bacterium]|nr:response regulator [Chitinispirillaceae bacterium]